MASSSHECCGRQFWQKQTGTKRQWPRGERLPSYLFHLTNGTYKKEQNNQRQSLLYDTKNDTFMSHIQAFSFIFADSQCQSKTVPPDAVQMLFTMEEVTRDAAQNSSLSCANQYLHKAFAVHHRLAITLWRRLPPWREVLRLPGKKQKHTSGFRVIDRAWPVQRFAHSILLIHERW